MREERNRGRTRRPKDTQFERQELEVERTYLDVLMECNGENALRELLTALGLKEGTERFQNAIDAWREMMRSKDA